MVYLVGNREENICKIGYSSDPSKRLHQLQVGCPYHLELMSELEGDMNTEKMYHNTFSHLSLKGEWFKLTDEIIQAFGAEEKFIKLYVDDIQLLFNITNASNSIMLQFVKHMDWENKLIINRELKAKIKDELDIKEVTINKCIETLINRKILYRETRGNYIVNPYLFAKGNWEDLAETRGLFNE